VPFDHPTIDHRERLWTGGVKSRPTLFRFCTKKIMRFVATALIWNLADPTSAPIEREFGNQVLISSHRKLPRSNAVVVSYEGNGSGEIRPQYLRTRSH
jgi:hypothetical protein